MAGSIYAGKVQWFIVDGITTNRFPTDGRGNIDPTASNSPFEGIPCVLLGIDIEDDTAVVTAGGIIVNAAGTTQFTMTWGDANGSQRQFRWPTGIPIGGLGIGARMLGGEINTRAKFIFRALN